MQDNLSYQAPVAQLAAEDRSQFIWKCYAHVIGAVLAFAAVSAYLFTSGISERIAAPMLGGMITAQTMLPISRNGAHGPASFSHCAIALGERYRS